MTDSVDHYEIHDVNRTLVRKSEVLSNFRFRTRVRVALQYVYPQEHGAASLVVQDVFKVTSF